MSDVGAVVYSHFRRDGYSPAASAGFVGNFQQESGLNPDEEGGNLDQGQGDRRHSGSLQEQLNAISAELKGGERGTAQALRGAKTPQQAALIISQKFERPEAAAADNDKRERYALEALHRYGGAELADVTGAANTAQQMTRTTSTLQTPPVGPSAAQSADVLELLRQSLAPPAGSSIASTTLARPQTSGGPEQAATAPRVPSAPSAPTSSGEAKQEATLALLAKLGQDAEPGESTVQSSSEQVPVAGSGSASGSAAPVTAKTIANARGGYGFTPEQGKGYEVAGALPQLTQRLNALGQAEKIKLTGLSGKRSPQHSLEVGGFADDPHTKALASDTQGAQTIPKATLNKYGLERPFPGSKEADHIQLLHSVNKNGGY